MGTLAFIICIGFILECVIALVWLAVGKVKEKVSYLTVYFMIPILGFSELAAISSILIKNCLESYVERLRSHMQYSLASVYLCWKRNFVM